MFGLKVGLKGLVLRLGFEVGSRDRVQSMDPDVWSHGWVPGFGFQDWVSRLGLKGGSNVLVLRFSPKIGSLG